MPDRTVLIVAAGEPPPVDLLRAQAAACEALYACDSAAAGVLAAGLTPTLVVGDMDSLREDLPADVPVRALAEQETTDLEKAFYTALAHGFEQAVVLGAGGRRWDHFYANLSVFARYADRLVIRAGDAYGWLAILPRQAWCRFPSHPGDPFSLLALPAATGITTAGLEWPLDHDTLALDGRLGTSNRATGREVAIRYETGCLAAYQTSSL